MNQERRKLQEIKEILDKMFYGSESATGMGGIWKFRYCAIWNPCASCMLDSANIYYIILNPSIFYVKFFWCIPTANRQTRVMSWIHAAWAVHRLCARGRLRHAAGRCSALTHGWAWSSNNLSRDTTSLDCIVCPIIFFFSFFDGGVCLSNVYDHSTILTLKSFRAQKLCFMVNDFKLPIF